MSLMLNGLLFDGGGGFAYTSIKHVNIEAGNLKTVWGAHKSPGSCEIDHKVTFPFKLMTIIYIICVYGLKISYFAIDVNHSSHDNIYSFVILLDA